MAVVVAIGDTLELTLVCKGQSQYSLNVRHYRVSIVGGSPATDADCAEFLDTQFNGAYKGLLSDQASYWGLKIQNIAPVKRSAVAYIVNRGPGVNAGGLMSTQTAGVIKLTTALSGRSKRGRIYIPFADEDSNTNTGKPEAAYLTDLNTLAGVFDDTQAVTIGGRTCTLVPVVRSRKLSSNQDITGAVARTEWGTQRRRSSINRPDADPLAV